VTQSRSVAVSLWKKWTEKYHLSIQASDVQ
jgi:hypothetical protein